VSNVKIENFFPTSVYVAEDVELADMMLPIAKKYLSDERYAASTIFKYKSTFNYDPSKSIGNLEEFGLYNSFICDHVQNFNRIKGYDLMNIKSITTFASEMVKDDEHLPHFHPNCSYSSVFYLQTPEGSSPICFDDSRPHHRFVNKPIIRHTMHNAKIFSIPPKRGMLLIFDAWIEHFVPKNNCAEGRITLVSNISDN
jgi:uncharacterized protein (TIGR02466 family)